MYLKHIFSIQDMKSCSKLECFLSFLRESGRRFTVWLAELPDGRTTNQFAFVLWVKTQHKNRSLYLSNAACIHGTRMFDCVMQ